MRRGMFDDLWNVLNGSQVFGNVLPYMTITAGRTAYKDAIYIFQRNRKPIYFIFYNIFRLFYNTRNPLIELRQLIERKYILQTFKRIGMRDLRELFARSTANALRWRICICKFRISSLQRTQLPLHHVIIIIGDFRCVLIIIFFIVVLQLLF